MHIGVMATYPPTECGIATFSSDLVESLAGAPGVEQVSVIAVGDGGLGMAGGSSRTGVGTAPPTELYPEPVVVTIDKGVRADYVRAARLTGRLGVDVVLVEHEYGIFGGRDGDYLLSFTAELPVPFAVTLHTVLPEPTASQLRVLAELGRRAAAVQVFTASDRDLIVSAGVAASERVHVVAHGAPEEVCRVADGPLRVIPVRGRAGVGPVDTEGRFVASSFGLLSPGKGIEAAIEAVARLAPEHPELLLVIAGRTHPEVARRHGEQYRLSLQAKVRELNVGANVTFDDRFLGVDELAELLGATDVFVTPYRNPDQAVSGALTFAVAAGLPVVSTRYRYATELLGTGAGRIVDIDDVDALATALGELIDEPEALATAAAEAHRVGAGLRWSAVGRATAEVLRAASSSATAPEAPLVDEQPLPPLRDTHLLTLTDDVGIVQHARGLVPDRSTGYCVDDVARLVQVAHRLAGRSGDRQWATIALRGLAFLAHAASSNPPGMRNFMAYDRRWLDEPHVGDHLGRTIQALGEVVAADPAPGTAEPAQLLLGELCQVVAEARPRSPRTVAYAALGLGVLEDLGPHRELLAALVDELVGLYDDCSGPGWRWFEDIVAYDNARLPGALLLAGRRLGDDRAVAIGLESLEWYADECDIDGPVLLLPGHGGRRRGEPHPGVGGEQPIDAAALVEAETEALRATGDPVHGQRALRAFNWFLGRNRARAPMYDPSSGGCRDGLEDDGRISSNEGAESTLVYWVARLTLEAAGLPVAAREAHRDEAAV